MRVSRRTLIACVVLGCLVATAWQPDRAAAAPSAAERETARSLMDDGDRLHAAGDLQAAMARYQSAHAIMHVPTTGYKLARVQAKLGLLVEARSSAVEVINLPVAAGEPKVFTEARRAAEALTSEIEPRVPSIKVDVAPADVVYKVSIDNVTLPAEARLVAFRTNPGLHLIRIEALGYATESREITLAEGQLGAVSVTLRRTAAEASAAPFAAPTLAQAPVLTEPEAPADPAEGGRVRGIIGLSVGGAVLIAGSVTGLISFVNTQDEKKKCPDGMCDASRDATLAKLNTLGNVANICIPIGLLGVGYGLYELLTLPTDPNAAAAKGGVSVAFTGTGAVLRGSL